jgi:small GTP-binding protein
MSDENTVILKTVLIGESGVGKTSIISQFVEDVFQKDQPSTIGGTFSTKSIKCNNGQTLKFEIWDTAGQERYRAVTKIFYKEVNVAILVYDITSISSFRELQKYWVEQVKESSPKNLIIAIIANKADLIECENVDEKEARNYAKSINAIFARTSAKNNVGVNDLFLEIAKKYTGTDSELTIEQKDEIEEYKKIRRESVKITKDTHKKNLYSKKRCCNA